MKKTFVLSFIAQIIVTLSSLLIFKFVSLKFSEHGLADYSFLKRNITFLYTIFLLGLGVAIPRYMANKIAEKSGEEKSFFLAANLIILTIIFFHALFFSIFKETISIFLFGDKRFSTYSTPIITFITALLFHTLLFSYFRGQMYYKIANLLQIVNIGIIPLLTTVFFAENIKDIFSFSGLGILFITLPILLSLWIKMNIYFKEIKKILNYSTSLLKYGIYRVPADFGIAFLFTVPSIIIAHTDNILLAGYIAFAISLLNITGHIIAPIGFIMLPKISFLLSKNDVKKTKIYTRRLFLFSLFISLFFLIFFEVFIQDILKLYLKFVSDDLILTCRKVLISVVFYPTYVSLRSVVDAYYTYPYNTLSVLLSLAFFGIAMLFTSNVYLSFSCAMCILFLSTLYHLRPLLK